MKSLKPISSYILRMSARNNEYYDVLGVVAEADSNEIRKQYRKLCLTHHPDKGGNPQSFQKIQKAYEILSDENKRNIYNQTGKDPDDIGGGPTEVDIGSMFANMFGGGGFNPFGGGGFNPFGGGGGGGGGSGPGMRRKKQKPSPKIHEIPISLYDYYHGKQISIQFGRNKFCETYGGEGTKTSSSCGPCKGSGFTEHMMQIGPGMHAVSRAPCSTCSTTGKILSGICIKCNGKKTFHQENILEIKVEPGMKPGDRLVFPNECSDDSEYIEPGDVYIILQNADESHQIKRIESDLHITHTITLAESLLGTSFILMNHPKWTENGLKIDIFKGVQTNDVIIVANEGMPKRNTKQFGNLCVKIIINVSSREKEILHSSEEVIRKIFNS